MEQHFQTILGYFVFGVIDFATFTLLLSGAQDILAGTRVQTSLVLFASMGPFCVVTFVVPCFVKRIPYFLRICVSVLIAIVGLVIVVSAEKVELKLFGVSLVSFGTVVIEISLLNLLSHFDSTVVSALSAGSGVGFFASPLYYLAMTTWLCVSPKITLILFAPLSLLYLACYYVIDKNRNQDIHSASDNQGVRYTKLENSVEDESQERNENKQTKSKEILNENFPGTAKHKMLHVEESLSWKEKMNALAKMLIVIAIPMFIMFYTEYLAMQSVITTIAYKNAPFSPRDHYQYYIFIITSGELIGRCHRSVISLINPSWLYQPTPKLLWVLTITEVLHLVFFVLESWYRFLPSVAIVLVLCFSAGMFTGVFFNNMLEVLHACFDEGKKREFVLGFTLAPGYLSVILAAILGFYVEPRLVQHCISKIADSALCFTRTTSINEIGYKCGLSNITIQT